MRHRASSIPLLHLVSRSCAGVLLFALTGCLSEPVEWGDVAYRQSQLGDPDTRSSILSANLPSIREAPSPCLRSIRSASAESDVFRVWWASRGDSSVVLSMQRSSDGGKNWLAPIPVDSRDRGGRGCDRPAPAIAYDPAHSMDNGGMFHAPVPVVYGNRPSAASVAADGDSVVVVFEDPNARTPTIGIVLSHTTGHIFEARGEATPDDVQAVSPWLVLDHKKITVFWKKPVSNSDGQTEPEVGYRVGIWK